MNIRWPGLAGKKANGERIAIMKNGDRLDLVASRKNRIVSVESTPCADLESITPLVADFCQRNSLADSQCTVLMSPGSYQLLLVEAPPVEEDELADALRWKVKDLLQSPVEESIVDGFMLPDDAYRGRQKMAYTVATNRADLQALADVLVDSGLNVDKVDIPELALLQLLQHCSYGQQAEMVLLLGRQRGFLAVVADAAIYLVRGLEISGQQLYQSPADAMLAEGGPVENLVLEMQRSRDYFESQVGKGVVNRVVLVPLGGEAGPLANAISERLGLEVSLLEGSVLAGDTSDPVPELLAAGAETLLLASVAVAD